MSEDQITSAARDHNTRWAFAHSHAYEVSLLNATREMLSEEFDRNSRNRRDHRSDARELALIRAEHQRHREASDSARDLIVCYLRSNLVEVPA